jgi:hypothetical protein
MTSPNPVIPVAEIGLTPIFPTIDVVPVVVIPDFDRITKFPAVPRFTAVAEPLLLGADIPNVGSVTVFASRVTAVCASALPFKVAPVFSTIAV